MKIFEYFKSTKDQNNYVTPVPLIEPAKSEQEYYSIGLTSEDRITFKTGISTITMNRKGCQNLIEQLTVFMNHLEEKNNE